MNQIPENVRQDLIKLIPSSVVNEISSFIFYDNHPRAEINIDITICTFRGELKEYYQRELVYSTLLDDCSNATEIRILRNSKSELFYLVVASDQIIVLSRKDKLQVVQRVTNVDKYDIEDAVCRGQAGLKVIRRDDAVPLIFDENFANLWEAGVIINRDSADETLPVVTQLMRKLTEAKYSVKCNEKVYKDLLCLRQLAAFSEHQKASPKSDDAIFNGSKEVAGMLRLKTYKPQVKLCNRKVIIILEVINKSDVPIENAHILLHGNTRPSINYTTKIFEKSLISPYFIENHSQTIKTNSDITIVAVINLRELKYNVTNKIEFCGVICYENGQKEHLLPFENVVISALDTMGEKFDILANDNVNEKQENIILAVIASSQKMKLCVRHIKSASETDIDILDTFCKYLKMDRVASNVIIHRKCPYHILYGIMIVQEENSNISHRLEVSLYTRTPSQVLAFIHYMQDAVPHRIIITTATQIITTKIDDLSEYNEETNTATKTINQFEYGTSILNQTSTILEYFDHCMIKMNASKNPVLQNKVGNEISLMVGDQTDYVRFKEKLLEQASRGINCAETSTVSSEPDCMVIDIDE